MSNEATIYHNPRCSKSRAAMELLTEKGVETDVVKYLETPPDRTTLIDLLDMLGLNPRDLMRKGEAEYKDNNLADESLSDDDLLDALLKYPKLMERPIVVKNGQAAIGRPIENIIDIL
ncbi:MAG: arsenate reductase (glutaredoxin) [Cocleimonas sp.]